MLAFCNRKFIINQDFFVAMDTITGYAFLGNEKVAFDDLQGLSAIKLPHSYNLININSKYLLISI